MVECVSSQHGEQSNSDRGYSMHDHSCMLSCAVGGVIANDSRQLSDMTHCS
jgi:hypothetical protein